MYVEFSFDDGTRADIRTNRLLNKYGICGTFYIPNCTELERDEIQIISKNHEIGGHTVNHPADMKMLDDESLKFEIEENKKWLEGIVRKKIDRFCYPRGRHDARVQKAVRKAGYKTARTTNVFVTKRETPRVVQGTTIHAFARKEYRGTDWLELAKEYLELVHKLSIKDYKKSFILWGHSREFDHYDEWDKLEEFFAFYADYIETNAINVTS